MNRPISVAIVGCGFMGVTHARAYLRAAHDGFPCRLTTICDAASDRLDASTQSSLPPDLRPDLASISLVRSLEPVLADHGVHLVSICTPTHTHVELASRALRAGKHVLLEKPASLDPQEIDALARLADESGRLCMPAMCIRFWPAWAFIADAIRDRRFGRVRRASFRRLATLPAWSSFYADLALSGGPLFDLHVHDTDFIVHALGIPTAVETTGDELHFTTRYTIPAHDAEISAEASWAQTPGQGFVMRCAVEFDDATIDFEFGRTPQLIVTERGCHTRDAPALPDLDGYDMEVRAIVGAIAAAAARPPATLDEAARVTRILYAEKRSLTTGRPITL